MKTILIFVTALVCAAHVFAAEPTAKKKLTLLAIGAHMDDAEGGIGGILISAAEAGHRVVVVVAVSDYSSWRPTIGREAQCKADQLALAKKFGFEMRFLDYPYHNLEANLELKRKLAAIANEVQPDIAFVQNTEDYWPDHVASGAAGTAAVLFPHGLSANLDAKKCPRVFSYCAAANQTIRFEPDLYVDITPVMGRYVDLLTGCDEIESNKPAAEIVAYETLNLKTKETLRLTSHGWERLAECVRWGLQSGTNASYALGLKTIWGPRDGRPLW
jgi:LmbE family N-acetylglucosaminyl deacetylase